MRGVEEGYRVGVFEALYDEIELVEIQANRDREGDWNGHFRIGKSDCNDAPVLQAVLIGSERN